MLIAFEGIDACGKTTLANAVMDRLQDLGHTVSLTSELGREESWSVTARERLMRARNKQEQYTAVVGARTTHYCLILRALRPSTIVLMDRYLLSTMAYQTGDAGLSANTMLSLHKLSDLPVPDLTIFVDLAPEVAEQRIKARGKADAFDSKGIDYFREVQSRYRSSITLLQCNDWNVAVINGESPLRQSVDWALSKILPLIKNQVAVA